jgi:hypothetical protein
MRTFQGTPGPGETTEESWRALLTPRRMLLLSLLLGGALLHAMNALITATLMPSIVIDIGGSGLMSWVATAFLASSIVAAAGTGIVTQAIGARHGYFAGAAIYGLGSILCALAPTMSYVIAGRFVQGLRTVISPRLRAGTRAVSQRALAARRTRGVLGADELHRRAARRQCHCASVECVVVARPQAQVGIMRIHEKARGNLPRARLRSSDHPGRCRRRSVSAPDEPYFFAFFFFDFLKPTLPALGS